jgi:hypothetical protein
MPIFEAADLHADLLNRIADLTVSEVEVALADVDQQALTDDAEGAFVTSVWDGASPINGADAAVIYAEMGQGVKLGLVSDAATGRVLVAQSINPETGQPTTAANVAAAAEMAKASLVDSRVRGAATQALLAAVAQNRVNQAASMQQQIDDLILAFLG